MGFYIGIDCSSRSVHFVVLDIDEKIVLMDKCVDTSKDIEARFNNVCTQFSDYITNQSDLFLDSVATIENPVMIQNVKATIMITCCMNCGDYNIYDVIKLKEIINI